MTFKTPGGHAKHELLSSFPDTCFEKHLVVLCYIMNFQLFLLLSENNIVQNFSYAL